MAYRLALSLKLVLGCLGLRVLGLREMYHEESNGKETGR